MLWVIALRASTRWGAPGSRWKRCNLVSKAGASGCARDPRFLLAMWSEGPGQWVASGSLGLAGWPAVARHLTSHLNEEKTFWRVDGDWWMQRPDGSRLEFVWNPRESRWNSSICCVGDSWGTMRCWYYLGLQLSPWGHSHPSCLGASVAPCIPPSSIHLGWAWAWWPFMGRECWPGDSGRVSN